MRVQLHAWILDFQIIDQTYQRDVRQAPPMTGV